MMIHIIIECLLSIHAFIHSTYIHIIIHPANMIVFGINLKKINYIKSKIKSSLLSRFFFSEQLQIYIIEIIF